MIPICALTCIQNYYENSEGGVRQSCMLYVPYTCTTHNAQMNRAQCAMHNKYVRRRHFYPLTDGVKANALTGVP